MTPSPNGLAGGRDLYVMKNSTGATSGMSNKFLNLVKNSDKAKQNMYAIKLENIRKKLDGEGTNSDLQEDGVVLEENTQE